MVDPGTVDNLSLLELFYNKPGGIIIVVYVLSSLLGKISQHWSGVVKAKILGKDSQNEDRSGLI